MVENDVLSSGEPKWNLLKSQRIIAMDLIAQSIYFHTYIQYTSYIHTIHFIHTYNILHYCFGGVKIWSLIFFLPFIRNKEYPFSSSKASNF